MLTFRGRREAADKENEMLSVRDLMTDQVETVRSGEDLTVVYDLMDARRIRHVPVLDEDDTLVGIVSQRDLLRGALGDAAGLPVSAQRDLLKSATVDAIMVTEPITVEPETTLREAGELLLEHKLGCLPVLDGDELVGILTESDFVRHTVEQL
jgi:CBS domain-containing protein